MDELLKRKSLVVNGANLGAAGMGEIAAFSGDDLVLHHRLLGAQATASLPSVCRSMLYALEWNKGLDDVIVVTGPGSFTGLRASLSFAEGLALGFGAEIRGVTVGQAFRAQEELKNAVCLVQARRDRIFADWPDGTLWAGPPEELVLAAETMVIGSGVRLLPERQVKKLRTVDLMQPDIRQVVRAARQSTQPVSLLPLYVDAPAASLPAQGLRPAPSE